MATLLALMPLAAAAQQGSDQELAKAAQNPVAAMISLPFQNNIQFGVGPHGDTANVLNIQPVIPFGFGDWNVITRTIAPIIYVPDLVTGLPETVNDPQGNDGSFGLGDVNFSAFLSPAASRPLVWGAGPSFNLPTATDGSLGSGKWSAGPSAVVVAQPGKWVFGALARQVWSFAGDDDREGVSQLLIQPFLNHNFEGGWYAVSAPIITANWKADSGDIWTIPVGGGFGRILRLGKLPINASLQAYYNVERPEFGPDWSLRLAIQFLFPK